MECLSAEFAKYFLNNEEIWFNPQTKYDIIISSKYRKLLDITKSDVKISHYILIFDQLPYYVYRGNLDKIRSLQENAINFKLKII
jgi:hypothetical protein